jgi:type I restriction enzyme S subunit
MLHVTKKSMEARSVPLPPRKEQGAIAAKLDTTLAAVDSCRQRLDGVEVLLKRFRQAVLAAATSGELTRKWRGERGASMDEWSQKCLGDVVIDIEAGLNVQCEERPPSDGERGLVKISAVTWGIFDENESKTLRAGHVVSEKNRIKAGDFLISRANTIELVGACVIVHEVNRALYLSDKVLRLLMPEEWKPWLLMCLRSNSGRDQIETLSSGNQLSMRNLSQKSLLSIRVPLPPPDEVEAAVTAANQLHAFADQLQAKLTSARQIVERLTPALLAKAFRGELVPQDPNDEPASELLTRIRSARQADPAAGKPSRRGRRKAAATPETPLIDTAIGPPDQLATLLRECGALSRKALLAASELKPRRFETQLALEHQSRHIQPTWEDGEELWEAVG